MKDSTTERKFWSNFVLAEKTTSNSPSGNVSKYVTQLLDESEQVTDFTVARTIGKWVRPVSCRCWCPPRGFPVEMYFSTSCASTYLFYGRFLLLDSLKSKQKYLY
ncbi:hypothetical protein AMECASPLE_032956 [Ameca splendens]|uniref:Uncharacterized protein n=1 Tax=Ameca splendens TaxID=208324 RepID=A0ABV1A4N3_9TELE